MIHYKSKAEVELIRESSLLVSKTLAEVAKFIRPGISTLEVDRIAEEFILANGGKPSFDFGEDIGTLGTSSANLGDIGILSNCWEILGDIFGDDIGILGEGCANLGEILGDG